ncbi:unnamed protein product [Allacma fusca]|uniref:Uncharacterized protein n=1 Tax=Allacma fusca TaxID=39272 RepID=A0A8J2P1N3_9HEXA|nr:unnamed protein product [Allacma fusca]
MSTSSDAGNHDTQAAVSTGVKNKRGKKPQNAGCNSTDEHVATGTQNVPNFTQMKTAFDDLDSKAEPLQGNNESEILNDLLNETFGSNEFGPVVSAKISEAFSNSWTNLAVPKVNSPMWPKMEKQHKSTNARPQGLQLQISGSLVANARIADILLSSTTKIPKETLEQLMRITMDSSTILGIGFRDIMFDAKLLYEPA